MKPELEEKMMRKYPKIFRQKDLSPQETCMCWGISTGDGWYNLIDNLCGKIQRHVDGNNIDQVEAMQVKEKFGGLRFYIDHGTEEIYNMIYEAENESYETCEYCGSQDNVHQTKGGWIVTLCDECEEKRNEK